MYLRVSARHRTVRSVASAGRGARRRAPLDRRSGAPRLGGARLRRDGRVVGRSRSSRVLAAATARSPRPRPRRAQLPGGRPLHDRGPVGAAPGRHVSARAGAARRGRHPNVMWWLEMGSGRPSCEARTCGRSMPREVSCGCRTTRHTGPAGGARGRGGGGGRILFRRVGLPRLPQELLAGQRPRRSRPPDMAEESPRGVLRQSPGEPGAVRQHRDGLPRLTSPKRNSRARPIPSLSRGRRRTKAQRDLLQVRLSPAVPTEVGPVTNCWAPMFRTVTVSVLAASGTSVNPDSVVGAVPYDLPAMPELTLRSPGWRLLPVAGCCYPASRCS